MHCCQAIPSMCLRILMTLRCGIYVMGIDFSFYSRFVSILNGNRPNGTIKHHQIYSLSPSCYADIRPAKIIYYICVSSLIWLSEAIKWKPLMPHQGFWKKILNHLPASHRFHQINWKPTPCLITETEYLPCFIVKFKIKCVPASWLIIAFSDTDLTLQFCLHCHRISMS